MVDYARENKDSDGVWSWAMEEVKSMQQDRDQLIKIQEKLANK